MTTFALVGAGPGLGLATARRFGAAGHTVALISRDAEKLEGLTAALARDDIRARAFPAHVLEGPSPRPCPRRRPRWGPSRSSSTAPCPARTS